jgi:hypothetical protein
MPPPLAAAPLSPAAAPLAPAAAPLAPAAAPLAPGAASPAQPHPAAAALDDGHYDDGFGPLPPIQPPLTPAHALDDQSFTLNWDDVELVPQPTNLSCWAASAAMVVGWRDRMSLTPDAVAAIAQRTTATGLDPAQVGQFAREIGLVADAPQSYSVSGMRQLLTQCGPLWVGADMPGLHAIVVTGLYSDGTATYVRISDPWDRAVGTPGAPGSYAHTHATGSRYIMTWEDFVAEYERAPLNSGSVNLQILHAASAAERTPNTGRTTVYAAAAADAGAGTAPPHRRHRHDAPPATRSAAPSAKAMIIDTEDVEQAQRYAPAWADLFNWVTPPAIVSALAARNMTVQRIQDAAGLLNLDRYEVRITQMPTGFDDIGLLRQIRLNLNDFVNTRNSEFIPYTPGDDDVKWASASPEGAVYKIDIFGPDNAAVVGSLVEDRRWRFTTIHTEWSGDHPVSGHREFGIRQDGDTYVVYTRAADRATDGILESIAFAGADNLWRSLQSKVVEFVNSHGGAASAPEPFSQRFHPAVVRILYGTAASLAANPTAIYSPMYSAKPVRALDNPAFSLNWDDVQLVPQPTDVSCWAAAGAMVIGWRDQLSLSPDSIASICRRTTATGLDPAQVGQFARDLGLTAAAPACYTADGFHQLLSSYGPLWIAADVPGLHAIVVTGMYSDGTNSYVRIADPWDRAVGTPGAPGAYANTHVTGSRYIMTWDDFVAEYERAPMNNGSVNLQILHADSAGGRTPNTGATTVYAAGFAPGMGRAAPVLPNPPPPHRRTTGQALDAGVIEIASVVAGAAMQRLVNNTGSITWQLDQLRDLKHPNDQAPPSPAPFHDAPTIQLTDWPLIENLATSQIWAHFSVDWQFNGRSLGKIRISPIGTNEAVGWSLAVTAQIMDDAIVYPTATPTYAAIRIRFTYQFRRMIGSDSIGVTDLHLFGDGQYERDSHWTQY